MAGVASPGRLASAVGFVILSFSLNSIVTRFIVAGGHLDPGLTTVVRFVAGAAALLLLLPLTGRKVQPDRRSILPAFWLGAYAICISYGYGFIGAAAGTFVFYACVLVTMTTYGAVKERAMPRPLALTGGVVALVGLAVLASGDMEETTLLGVALLAVTGVSWGAYSVLGSRHPDAGTFSGNNFLLLALPLIPAGAAGGAGLFGDLNMSWLGFWTAVTMGVLTTALSYIVWYWALAHITRIQAGTYQLLIPVLTAVLAVVLLGEAFPPRLWIAGTLVVLGMGLATYQKRPKAAKS